MKTLKFVLLILFISIPTFYRMLIPGIYSMQDFHLFRLYEFDKCIRNFQVPCRWAPDAGLGYGEPLFNFYGQGAYIMGEIFHLGGVSLIDSTKALFALSLMGSGVAMYFLARKLWKNNFSVLMSPVLYMYAPYRVVDVWVRGALPEALSFVLFPLIILSVEKKNLFYFSLLVFVLIITHNLSFVMFLPLILVWIIYKKWWKGFTGLAISFLLSAFYILPVLFESKYINLESTVTGYFDFRAHFVTLKQIFLSYNWGYGGSTWGDKDNLNLSVGFLQWIVPFLTLIMLAVNKKLKQNKTFLTLFISGIFYLFLTHNRSTFIWEVLPFMKYIQFPWRFLGIAVFCFALASGAVISFLNNRLVIFVALTIISLLLIINYPFSRPDIWYKVSDSYFTTGVEWDRQRGASIGDFWPNFGHKIPDKPATGEFVNYFPGWVSSAPQKSGLIESKNSVFKNTLIRTVGNVISLVSILGIIVWRKKL